LRDRDKMPGTLFYEVLGTCEYLPKLKQSLDEVSEELSFEGKRLSKRFTRSAVESVRNQIRYFAPITLPSHTYSEIRKFGDRKIFFWCNNALYDFCKEREIKMCRDLFEPSSLIVKESEVPSGEGLPSEVKNFIEKTLIGGIKRGEKALKKYEDKIKPKKYDVEDIVEKDMTHPSVIPLPWAQPLFTSSNKDVNRYYDWTFYPYFTMVIPSTKFHKKFLTSEISPTSKHELLHTFQRVTNRTEEGQDIKAMELFIPQGFISCADMNECVGVDLAFYMEGWRNLGKLCKKSVDSYQKEVGDVPVKI
jgi:hypothetical protein